ncbi:uncharacterized protein LOC123714492 isoform X1 [Pieris brassicae]|uniref:SAM domain-containing protein n=2 Tax=Pieris brassicae TaxID=7116 RepID=A0A9P0X3G7_PIEBR|nr:uncharacterized protein LOC123714492 isoform X1 [Pieris brassicae]CAH3976233.1 unnamed protein product [Pieris brassicae]
MAKTVRKVKRGKAKESSNVIKAPAIVVTSPDNTEMTVKAIDSQKINDSNAINENKNKMDFNVNQLIAELSENSHASKGEIEQIQRRLLQQANEILKVNAFVNPEPRVISATQKGSIYGIPHTNGLSLAQGAQLVPEKLTNNSSAMISTQRVTAEAGSFFFETGSASRVASPRAAPIRGTVESVPPYRMPPAPEAALPGAPAPILPAAIHTHSAKFPIEREVILSSGDKNSKVPILQEARKRGRLGAVAPDTPPKALSAWTHAENQAGTSGDFRQYHDQYGYAHHQGQNLNRSTQNYDSPKPPIPAKNTPNNSHMVTVVETTKDSTRDAPKSTKSVTKTYHTLKDMISSKFKGKENNEADKEESLNNNNEERRREPEPVTPREVVRKEGIYGRPMQRPELQYNHGMTNNMVYSSPSPHRQLMQQQMVQQQMMNQQVRSQEILNQQARSQEMLNQQGRSQEMLNQHGRSQEMLAHRPQALGADALYQQYGPPGRRSAMYQRDLDVRSMANFTSLKSGPQPQYDNSNSRLDLRSPQQLEREIVQHRRLIDGRRSTSHPHLLDEPQRPEPKPQVYDRSRRNSHGNLLDGTPNENGPPRSNDERESDDGGFRMKLAAQGRSSFERIRTSGRSVDSRQIPEEYRRTPDSLRESRRTPDSINQRQKESTPNPVDAERNDESASQKSADSVYTSNKGEGFNPQPSSSRQTPSRIEDLKAHGKKGTGGSAASSDYDKNGGQSSNVDSGRGSVAYSSGRRADASLHDTSADSDAAGTRELRQQPQPGPSQQNLQPAGENEWADLVECELRQILEPKLSNMRLDSSDSSDSSITPPLPPLSPSSDLHKRNSLPGRSSEYPEERRRRDGRESPRWHGHSHSHKKHSSKRDHHYKRHLFGLDTTDMTSTTTRSLDLSSLLDGRTDSDASTGDARAIRRQLRGLENMYAEVLQLLGVRKPASLAKQPTWEARLSSKRRYGSMSSLPSSSVSSRPQRDKRRSSDHRKKNDLKGINKRFQRLESHVVTLARSVAHLSSEMRTQHLVMQEMDNIRAEIAALRHMYKSQQYIRSGHSRHLDPFSFSNPDRVKRLTKFFGDEPPLMRLFLKKLGYEKYAAMLEKEKVGAAELPYVGEDKLRALGVPLGPRMRILKEAGIHHDLHFPRDDPNTTTTTLAIV